MVVILVGAAVDQHLRDRLLLKSRSRPGTKHKSDNKNVAATVSMTIT
ncbi:hypothetical protein GCM10023155_20900 [Bremerella cremea]